MKLEVWRIQHRDVIYKTNPSSPASSADKRASLHYTQNQHPLCFLIVDTLATCGKQRIQPCAGAGRKLPSTSHSWHKQVPFETSEVEHIQVRLAYFAQNKFRQAEMLTSLLPHLKNVSSLTRLTRSLRSHWLDRSLPARSKVPLKHFLATHPASAEILLIILPVTCFCTPQG